MSDNLNIAQRCLLAAALAAALPVQADGRATGDLQFHGFASQGFVLSEGNNINGSSADSSGSLRYQEFGVNASWRPRGDLLLAGQLASVRAGHATDEYLLLEYGLVDYTPWQGERGRFGIRAGKLKLPIGFYNDSRDAVFTRPSIVLPQGVYLDTSGGRAFGYFSSWGATLYGDIFAGNHALYLEAGGFGEQSLGDTADVAILRADANGEFEVNSGGLLRIIDEYDGGRLRAAVSLMAVNLDYVPDGQPFSPTNPFAQEGELSFRQAVLSLQYNWQRFTLTGEYVWRKFRLDDLIPHPAFSTAVDLSPSGAYLQGTWRVTPRWSTYLRYDEQYRDEDDRHGREQSVRFGQPRHYFFARDWMTGTRFDINSNLAVWGEFHYVDGVAWVNPLDNPDFNSGTAERYWNYLALMLGYRF